MSELVLKESAADVNWKLEGNFLLPATTRGAATEYLATVNFPTTRQEDWKYTRVTKIKNANLAIQPPQKAKYAVGLLEEAVRLVFVNGHFSPESSIGHAPNGVKMEAFSQMDSAELEMFAAVSSIDQGVFQAINSAYLTDGLYVHVSANCQIEKTIEIVHVTDGTDVLSNFRTIIICERSSSLKVVQRFISEGETTGFTNAVSEIQVASNASLIIDKVQEESAGQYHVSREIVQQASDSTFTINTITLDGGLVRNDLRIAVDGSNCETNLNGAYILSGNQHVDNHTVVDHLKPHCQSNELYKGVIDGNATAVFNGKVFVRKDAQKINAFQSNANVLMSDNATVNSKPELEIYADDVKCSHGSTTGQIDEEAVFYLRARGIGEASARRLMVSAFIEDVLSKVENEVVLEYIHRHLQEKLNWQA